MVRQRLRHDQRGEVTEAVLVTPVLLFLVMLILHFGLWFHAEHVVRAAAEQGVRAARLDGATAADGQRRAEEFLAGSGLSVGDPAVTVTRDDDRAVARVSGRSVAVIPGLRLAVSAESELPVERFRP